MTEQTVSKYWRAFNPTSGCSDRFPCWDRCWARGFAAARPQTTRGSGFEPTCHPEVLHEPGRWHPERWGAGFRLDDRPVVATTYMGDLFDPSIPFEFIGAVYGVEAAQEGCTFLHLTKTVDRRREFLRWLGSTPLARCAELARLAGAPVSIPGMGDDLPFQVPPKWPLHHVWEGTSISMQEDVERIDDVVVWLSVEPLLERVDLHLSRFFYAGKCRIRLVIVGPETGRRARKHDPEWINDVRRQCESAGVRCLVKSRYSA